MDNLGRLAESRFPADESMYAQAPTTLDAQQHLEDYVNSRIIAFAKLFAAEVAPTLQDDEVERITQRLLTGQRAVSGGSSQAAAGQQGSQPATTPTAATLVYKHDCRALGCRDEKCLLCQYNPERVCERNFQKKYLVGDPLRAKCGAPIRLELVDDNNNVLTNSIYSNLEYELNIVDGTAFKECGGDVQQLSNREFKGCIKHTRKEKADPLLCYKSPPAAVQRVMVRLINGAAVLPELTVSESSEALLAGRRPPFQLVAWMSDSYGHLSSAVRYGVSDAFVVATRRVRQANKVEIPLIDDPVSKVENIGRETVKKLADLRIAALECGLADIASALDEEIARVETVGQLQRLLRLADNNTQLRKALQLILKLPKDRWEETAAHAMSAVIPDFRRRVWHPPGHSSGLGLVFTCKYGAPMVNHSVGLAQKNEDDSIKVTSEDQLDAASLDILRHLKSTAIKHWAEPQHPGWSILNEPDAEAAAAAAVAAVGGALGAAAVGPAALWATYSRNGSFGSRGSTGTTVDPAAAAALPVPVGVIKAAAAAGPAAAAAAASQDPAGRVPAVGSKRSADMAGLSSAAAAAVAEDDEDEDDWKHDAAAEDAGQRDSPSSAAVVDAFADLACKTRSQPEPASTAAAAAATSKGSVDAMQAAAAAAAAAYAAGAAPSSVVAKLASAMNRGGVPESHDDGSDVEDLQDTVVAQRQLSRNLPVKDMAGRLTSSYARGLTGLDAVAAAAAAAEASEAAAKLEKQQQNDAASARSQQPASTSLLLSPPPQQQQQQPLLRNNSGKAAHAAAVAVEGLTPTAIAAAIVKRLTGTKMAAAAAAARGRTDLERVHDNDAHGQQQRQQGEDVLVKPDSQMDSSALQLLSSVVAASSGG